MGYFSEMALNKQEELGLPAEQVSAGNAFEDEETFDHSDLNKRIFCH